jgi:antitoxin ParD1/3/4
MTNDSIPEELRSFVQAELGSGRYASLDELLVEGLRVLREHEAFIEGHREALRTLIAEGVAQAERGELLDGEEVLERLRQQLVERSREG